MENKKLGHFINNQIHVTLLSSLSTVCPFGVLCTTLSLVLLFCGFQYPSVSGPQSGHPVLVL
jgi:hypothetical protein